MSPQDMVWAFMQRTGQFTRMDRSPGVNWERMRARRKWLREEHTELQDAIDDHDVEAVLDGACDLVYIVLGMLCEMGVSFDDLFAEVHRSNMTKGSKRGPDGKILKDENYRPPDLRAALEATFGAAEVERLLCG